jgi:hypothetical protein
LAPPLECAAGPKADQDQTPPGREGLDATENIHASRGGEEGNFSLDIPFYRIAKLAAGEARVHKILASQ